MMAEQKKVPKLKSQIPGKHQVQIPNFGRYRLIAGNTDNILGPKTGDVIADFFASHVWSWTEDLRRSARVSAQRRRRGIFVVTIENDVQAPSAASSARDESGKFSMSKRSVLKP